MRSTYAVLFSLLLAVPAVAEEAFTLKIKLSPDVGKTWTSSNVSKDSGSTKLLSADGKLIVEIKPGGSETIKRDTVLEIDKDGQPTKYLRFYEKATEIEDGKSKTFSYQGRTLLFEKGKDGKFRIGLAGKEEIDPKDAAKLFDKANKPSESEAILKQLNSQKPIKVGDSLKLNVKPVGEAMDAQLDEAKSSITLKLTKVATKGKTTVGTFEFDQRLLVKGMKEKVEMTFDPPAEYTMKGTLELPIDGTSTEVSAKMSAKLKGEGTWSQAGQTGKIVFDVSGDITANESAESDNPALRKTPTVTWLAAPGEWSQLKPRDSSFHVDFPAPPKEEAKKDARGNNTVQWTASIEGGAVAFIVAKTDFAGADPAKVDAKLILETVAKNQKDPKNLKDIKQNGFPGIEFQREESTGGKTLEFHHRVVMVGGRMYQQIVIAEKDKAKPTDVERFMKSFEILEKPKKKDD